MLSTIEQMHVAAVIGLRDRALIALLFYSLGRVSPVLGMNVKDYHRRGKRFFSG